MRKLLPLFYFFLTAQLFPQSELEVINEMRKLTVAELYTEVVYLGEHYLSIYEIGDLKPVALILMLDAYVALGEAAEQAGNIIDTLRIYKKGVVLTFKLLSFEKYHSERNISEGLFAYYYRKFSELSGISDREKFDEERYREELRILEERIKKQPFPWPPPKLEWPKKEEQDVII